MVPACPVEVDAGRGRDAGFRQHPGAEFAAVVGAVGDVGIEVEGAFRRAQPGEAGAGQGDLLFVPPYVPHQEIHASTDETLECVLVRSDNEAVVVNLEIEPVEKPESVLWTDPIHKG